MAHYASLDENNVVTAIFVGKDEDAPLPEGFDSWEQYYNAKRCSYNTRGGEHPGGPEKAFRKNYPAVGWAYDETRDAFIPPKPFPSWTLNEQTCFYEPPVPPPVEDNSDPFSYSGGWVWDEPTLSWVYESFAPTGEQP